MAKSYLWAGLVAAVSACALSVPAGAQFGSIFNGPPRPPASVPGGQQQPQQQQRAPAPFGAPQMPPEEADIDDEPIQQPQQRYTPPRPQQGYQQQPQYQQQPGQGQNPPQGQYRQDAVRSQPLAPPPGGAAPLQQQQQPQQQPAQQQPAVPPVGQPQQARGAPPPPANTAPQPGDEVVVAPPTQKIVNPTAVFAGLDKITGRITSFDVAINETVQFGALRVTPRACYTRPPTETANTDGFVEVNEVTLQGEVKQIFSGWMFAASPGLHAVEHPIYDVWLTDCKGAPSAVADAQPEAPKPPPARTPAQQRAATPRPPAQARAPAPVRQPTLQQPAPQQGAPVGPPPGFR